MQYVNVGPERIGNYRIDGELGRDATGVVYEARHLVLPRRAVVKVMETAEPRPLAVQLLREACILEALEHPGIVRVFESGLLPDRRPWFAHERVEGATVADLLAEGPLEAPHAVVLVRDIAEVLEHAHRRGVVHCGLRPDRIVITGRTRGFPLCIADWSDARIHDTASPGPVLVDRAYAAPEQIDGGPIDDRVDVFSLGVIAYQVLTGVVPTLAPPAIDEYGNTQYMPAQVRAPKAPPELTSLVDQMIAYDRWDRPSSAEVHAELVQLAHDLAPPAPRPPSDLRIRRPRWTPEVPFSERAAEPSSATEAAAEDTPEKPS
jgi:eukaryotic-like serine/threonine-protein kinase